MRQLRKIATICFSVFMYRNETTVEHFAIGILANVKEFDKF